MLVRFVRFVGASDARIFADVNTVGTREMVFVQHREMAEQERAEASASPDSATENLETSGEEQEILVVPHVELYEVCCRWPSLV